MSRNQQSQVIHAGSERLDVHRERFVATRNALRREVCDAGGYLLWRYSGYRRLACLTWHATGDCECRQAPFMLLNDQIHDRSRCTSTAIVEMANRSGTGRHIGALEPR